MASTKMATVEITCNTKRATERLNQYVTQAREKISELDRLTTQLNEKRRQGLEITKEEIALQKQLETEIRELNTAQTRGVDDLKKARDVMDNLANSSIKEVKKAIRDMTKEMNGLRDIEGIRSVQKDIDRLKESLEEKLGAVNIDEVLNNLSSTPIEKLEEALKKLDAQERKLSANQTAEADKLHAKRERIQRQLDETRMKTRRLIDVEAVLGNKGAYSVKQLQAAYDQLKQKLTTLNTGQTKEIDKTKKQMAELKGEIDRVTGSVKKQSSALRTTLKNLAAYAGVFAIFNKIKSTLTDLVKKNVEFSDELTNIRKVSQLTEFEINKMAVSLSKIDTRTSIHELNNLAYAGAKLGMGKYGAEGLTSFVRAADKVNVALKEDLGDDALTAMSKLVEVMGLIPKMGIEKSMDAAGSAIFMLSTSSTSTGANIIEFSKRLMGLANVSHVATDELLALGSASDAMGLMPEVAATAFNKVFTSIQTNTKGIAKALGDTNGELQAFIDKGQTMQGIVYVLDKMNSMSVQEMQGRGLFKALGSDGARLNNVITTMADRVDMLKDHLDISNEAFKEGTAIQVEYAMQMESAAGYVDRAANVWEKAFVNPEGVDLVKEMAVEWYNVSREMTSSASTMAMIKGTLSIFATLIGTIVKLLPVLIRLMMFYGVGTAIQYIYNQVRVLNQALLSASASAGKLNAVLKANAFAFVFATAMTLATSLWDVATAEDEAKKKADALNIAIAEADEEYKRSKKSLDEYIEKLNDSSLKEDERRKILRNFNNEYGTYINKLGLETSEVIAQTSAYNALNEELQKNARYKMIQKLNDSYVGEAENVESAALGRFLSVAQQYGFDATPIIEKRAELGADELLQMVYNQLYNNQLQWSPTNKYQYKRPGSNATYSTSPVDFVATDRTKDIYNAITGLVPASRETKARKEQVEGLVNKYGLSDYDPDEMTLELALSQLDRLSKVSLDNLNKGLSKLRIEWGKLTEEQQKTDEQGIKPAINKYEAQIRKMTYRPGSTKEEIRDAKKALQDEKQALRKDLQDAKQESDAIIAKIEEWYRLQETVITDMQADGKLTKEQADQTVRTLNIAKNTALRDARLAISGRDTEAWETTKQQIGNLMLDQGQWSQELLQQILEVSMDAIRRNLSRIDKGGGKYGITTSSLKDAVDKNAAGNQREIARLMARSQEEVEKIFMEYDFFEQAMRGFSNRLAQMGILSETARQMAERLSDANNPDKMFSMKDYDALLKGNEGAKQQMLQAFIRSGAQPYGVNPEDKEQLRAWFMEFVGEFVENEEAFGGAEYQYQSWAKPFEQDFELWLRDSDKYLSSIQSFYLSLMKSEEDYYEKRKQSYNHYKKQLDQQDMAAGIPTKREDTERKLQTQATLQENGIGASFWRQQGLGGILNDPEVMLIQKRIEWRNQDLESAKALLAGKEELWAKEKAQRMANGEKEADIDADLAQRRMGFEDLIKERQTSLFEQQLNLTTKIAQEMRKRVQTVNNLTKPIQDGALNIGKKFGEMLAGVEEQSMTWKEIWHSMAVAVGESVIDMTAQYAQNLIMEKAMNAQSKQEAINKANVDVAAGTASGAAKTIGTLGWWGIALIPVIAALLKGLLQAAFASNKSSSTANSSSNIKTKLVSGMLTYDEGNVYAGTDGHVYRAIAQSSLPAGVSVVRHPIATTVNGHNALVAERGPEIVIGRRATRHIQMNEPGLLRHLAAINGRYRTHDEGTVPDEAPSLSGRAGGEADERLAAALDQNTQIMAAFVQMMNTIQQRGIPAHINKFGPGGLVDEVKSGLKFDARYRR